MESNLAVVLKYMAVNGKLHIKSIGYREEEDELYFEFDDGEIIMVNASITSHHCDINQEAGLRAFLMTDGEARIARKASDWYSIYKGGYL